jgi:hypothetical protein
MTLTTRAVLLLAVLAVLTFPQSGLFAAERYTVSTVLTTTDFRFNNENWFTAPHPKIATFTVNEDGSAYGLTENSIPFSQYNIANSYGIRIQRFEMQDHYHYIVNGQIAYTPAELSIELAKALERQSV